VAEKLIFLSSWQTTRNETIFNTTVSICKLFQYIRTVSTRNYALLLAAHHIERLPTPSIPTSWEDLSRSPSRIYRWLT